MEKRLLSTYRETGVHNVGKALRSSEEEFYASTTHGLGFLLSACGSVALLTSIPVGASLMLKMMCSFYCVALMGVFAASSLSHVMLSEKWNSLFRSLDQGFIYLLIIGTMAPLGVKNNPNWQWSALLLRLSSVGVFGFLTKVLMGHQLAQVSLWLYLVLGWGQVIAFGPLLWQLPNNVLAWILIGGLTYSLGYVFLTLDIRRYHFHTIWHIFVILGSACHYLAIWQWVTLA